MDIKDLFDDMPAPVVLTSTDIAAAWFALLNDAQAEAARKPRLDFADMLEAA